MDNDMMFLEQAGIDIRTGLDYTRGRDKYLSAVRRFYKSFEKNSAKVEEYYAAKDYESYMITVHALKSNAKMIGALDLSKGFESLEMAARNNDLDFIGKETENILSQYRHLIEMLKPVEALGDVRAADEISAEEARDTAGKLLEALDDFDDNLSKKLAGKLANYPFRITQRDMLGKAREYIDDFLYDEASEIIREIYKTIE